MTGRHRAYLRSTSNVSSETGRSQINLPPEIWKQMDWKLNDHLKVDVLKDGMSHSLYITKEEKVLTLDEIRGSWDKVIERLEEHNAKIAHFLEDAILHRFNGEELTIGLPGVHKWHFKTISKDAPIVQAVIDDIYRHDITLKFELLKRRKEDG